MGYTVFSGSVAGVVHLTLWLGGREVFASPYGPAWIAIALCALAIALVSDSAHLRGPARRVAMGGVVVVVLATVGFALGANHPHGEGSFCGVYAETHAVEPTLTRVAHASQFAFWRLWYRVELLAEYGLDLFERAFDG